MKSSNNGSTEYEKAMRFLEIGCNCGCSKKIPRERFAELREAFQALSRYICNGSAKSDERWRDNYQPTS